MSYVELSIDPNEATWGDGSMSGDMISGKTVLTVRTPGLCVRFRGTYAELAAFLAAGLERVTPAQFDGGDQR